MEEFDKVSSVFENGLLKEEDLGFKVIDPLPGAPLFYNLRCCFKDGQWQEPEITTDRELHLRMEAGCHYYGHTWFEGLTAHLTKDGRCLLFRPRDHIARARISSEILSMEVVPESLFMEAVKEVVKKNAAYIPCYGTEARLYLRPFLLGTNPQLGLKESWEFLFVVFAYPVGPYYPKDLSSKKLYCSPRYDRVAERGTGKAKNGGNYTASYPAKRLAQTKGCGEYLYLDCATRSRILETGSSNFIALRADEVLVTPDEAEVLESITNLSLQTIAAELMGFKVEKRRFPLNEFRTKKGPHCFFETALCGTAARVQQIELIVYENYYGRDRREFEFKGNGKWCHELYQHLVAIQYGDEKDRWDWTEEVKL